MTVPGYFCTQFAQDEELSSLLEITEEDFRIYAASSLGEGPNPQYPPFPFLVWNELPSTAFGEVDETSNAQQTFYTFYFYDEKGRLDRIRNGLMAVRRLVKDMRSFRADDGTFCMETKWMGFSEFFTDRTYDASVRFGTARFDVSQ